MVSKGVRGMPATKYETTPPKGLFQPLPISKQAWADISIDFIEGLQVSQGFNTIFVMVDGWIHEIWTLMTLTQPYTTASVAQVFLNSVFKLHGF